jgi:succinyl-CoA synthetase beta subunit
MAEGIVKFANENKGSIPVVVRMVGNQEEKGAEILKNAGIRNIRSLEEAVAEVSKVITNGNTVR